MLIDGTFKADGYKVRMQRGKWYLLLFLKMVDTNKQMGPFSYAEAMEYVKDYQLADVERHLVKGDRP